MMDSMKHSSYAYPPPGGNDTSQIKIFLVLIIIAFIIMLIFKVYVPFIKMAKHFKMEMRRSDGEEYYYWRSQLRKLYRKYIPFASLFMRKSVSGSRKRRRHH